MTPPFLPYLIALAASTASTPEVPIPSSSVPVVVDGIFADEWDDARSIELESHVILLKEVGEFVYVGVERRSDVPMYVDLYLKTDEGDPVNLHASMQLGERSVVLDGGEIVSKFEFGEPSHWSANVLQYRPDNAPGAELTLERFVPHDGMEFEIERAAFPGRRWHLRLYVHALGDGSRSEVYPEESSLGRPHEWAVLTLPERES